MKIEEMKSVLERMDEVLSQHDNLKKVQSCVVMNPFDMIKIKDHITRFVKVNGIHETHEAFTYNLTGIQIYPSFKCEPGKMYQGTRQQITELFEKGDL